MAYLSFWHGGGKVFQLRCFVLGELHNFWREVRKLGDVNAERLVARARADLVEHRELAGRFVNSRFDVPVRDANGTLQPDWPLSVGHPPPSRDTLQGLPGTLSGHSVPFPPAVLSARGSGWQRASGSR